MDVQASKSFLLQVARPLTRDLWAPTPTPSGRPMGPWSVVELSWSRKFFDAGGSTSRPTLGRPVVQCPPHI